MEAGVYQAEYIRHVVCMTSVCVWLTLLCQRRLKNISLPLLDVAAKGHVLPLPQHRCISQDILLVVSQNSLIETKVLCTLGSMHDLQDSYRRLGSGSR